MINDPAVTSATGVLHSAQLIFNGLNERPIFDEGCCRNRTDNPDVYAIELVRNTLAPIVTDMSSTMTDQVLVVVRLRFSH